MRVFLIIVGGLLLCGVSAADNCNAVAFRGYNYNRYHAVNRNNQVYVPAVVYDTFAVTGQVQYPQTGIASSEELYKVKLELAELKLQQMQNYNSQLMQQQQQPQQQKTMPQAEQTLDVVAHQVLKTYCASCHSGAKSRGPKDRGPVQIFNQAGKFELINTDVGELWAVISTDHMPLGADEGKRPGVPAHLKGVLKYWDESQQPRKEKQP